MEAVNFTMVQICSILCTEALALALWPWTKALNSYTLHQHDLFGKAAYRITADYNTPSWGAVLCVSRDVSVIGLRVF